MITINFQNNKAEKLYRNYLKRVKRMTRILSHKDEKEIVMELNSHIYEGLQKNPRDNELEKLVDVLDKLGDPEEYLKPAIAERKLQQATHSFNPKDIFKALILNLGNGLKFSVFALLYLSLLSFIFIIIAKIIWPENTGLFYMDNTFKALGFIKDTYGTEELLGMWLLPICIAIGLACYFILTLLVRYTAK